MKKLFSGFLLALLMVLNAQPVFAAIDCSWQNINNQPAYCVGGFASPADANNYNALISCSGGALSCGLGGGAVESTPINHGGPFARGSNGYYTCLTSGYTAEVANHIDACLHQTSLAGCFAAGAGAVGVTLLTGGVGALPAFGIALGACGLTLGAGEVEKALNTCGPVITGNVADSSGNIVCGTDYHATVQEIKDQIDDAQTRFNICNQVPPTQVARLTSCQNCAAGGGVWTSIGCINYTPQAVIGTFVRVGLGIAGGVALLMILAAAFLLSTSQGDPKRTGQAKDMVTAAVIGLLFVIFSVTILQFLGVTVLHLPGFGV